MKFGDAFEALKEGKQISREGWNEKGMFLFVLTGGKIPSTAIHDPLLRQVLEEQGAFDENSKFEALPTIRMFTADRKVLTGWIPSQSDMFAEDWMVLNSEPIRSRFSTIRTTAEGTTKFLGGHFKMTETGISLQFESNGTTWQEEKDCLIALRNEVTRQLENEHKCPMNPEFKKRQLN
jgi:hypothetical protein